MKKKKSAIKGVDAMAIKDGYIATSISPEEIHACNDKGMTLKGPYKMEYFGKEVEDEDEEDTY
jgi:hypothetical protein